jgi:hypothetical protein
MSSWKEGLTQLERELPPNLPLFQVHESLPIAILRYDPPDEWELRRQLSLLASRLEARGRRMVRLSLADVLWEAVDRSDPPDAFTKICEKERANGFDEAHADVGRALNPNTAVNPRARTFAQRVGARLMSLDPGRDIAFLVRVGALGPNLYPVHNLVEHFPREVRVPTVLCYPGQRDGQTGLIFLGLPHREANGSYRVNIYG